MIGGLGVQELLIVLVIAMVLFGGRRLPEIGQNLGKALRGFKEGSEEEEKQQQVKADAAETEEEKPVTGTPASEAVSPENEAASPGEEETDTVKGTGSTASGDQ